MLMAFIIVLIVIVLVGGGLLVLHHMGILNLKGKDTKVTEDAELDESIPVEDLHEIVKRQYITSPYIDTQVLSRVVCVCGWQASGARQDFVKDQGDKHVSHAHNLIKQKRAAARKVAEKLAENEKGDFAW